MRAIELLMTDTWGVHIPQRFCELFDLPNFGLSSADSAVQDCLAGPDRESYWEAWEAILNRAEFHHDGSRWLLHQDGDLWLICYERMTDEERSNFGFEEALEEEAA